MRTLLIAALGARPGRLRALRGDYLRTILRIALLRVVL
jgi:hypothetical protein